MKLSTYPFAAASLLSGALLISPDASAQISGPLYQEIAQLDSLQFGAFNARNLDQLMCYFDRQLELYQDNTGVRNCA